MSEPDDNIIHEEEKLNDFKIYRNIAPVTTDDGKTYGNGGLIGKYTGKNKDRFTFTLSSPSSDEETPIILDLESSKQKNFVPFTEIVTSEQSVGDIAKNLTVGFINTANNTLLEFKNSGAVLNHPGGGSKVSKKRSKTRKSKRRHRRSKKSKTRKSKRHQCRSKKIRSRLKNS